ncbi:MAG: NAD(P)-dependent alcohol dehydrogenase [Melioribacteraceae bacterium]|nr:NAD(P)-dependent alcohol dehydrogenase [Melioribacteraceae bacterium]
MIQTKGYAAKSATTPLEPWNFERREVGAKDVHIKILYCGVCHSDIHFARSEWFPTNYPLVPGHEIVGKVLEVGNDVTKYNVGDTVGVGCLVDSCHSCPSCEAGQEQFCAEGMIGTYGSQERGKETFTQGGYSDQIVVDEHFVLRIPENLPLDKVAPLLCAGITTYSPIMRWRMGEGDKVAVLGLGGLGHMAVKIASSLGAEVTMLSTSPEKEKDAKKLGATNFVLTTNEEQFKKYTGYFNFIINTVSAQHDYNKYMQLLGVNGVMVCLGVPPVPTPVHAMSLVMGNKTIQGSLIGGLEETQEMLDYCGLNNITSDVEVIPIDKINEAFDKTIAGDVHYRFVIDMATLK